MKLIKDCDTCGHKIKIDYDETVCSVEYCPFCGEEMSSDDGDYEIEDDIETSDEWD